MCPAQPLYRFTRKFATLPVCTITLDRPDKANALTCDMLSDIAATARSATQAKVVVLTGTGKVFSAGADLDAARAGLATDPIWEAASSAIADLPGLTIAALNGTVAGGAFGIVLACDIRVAVPSAKFFYPVMKLGFLPQASDPRRLAALVGPSRAKMILMGGCKITASEAYDWGLIDRIADDLDESIAALSADTVAATHTHVAEIKQMVP